MGKRDFIVMEIRGTGFARPALNCGNIAPTADALRSCRNQLAQFADLSQYHSAAVARDLSALRQALGYKAWNLFGESYGTRLALTAMRDTPHGIRSVVLDSVVAPEVDALASGPLWMSNSVETLIRNCAADSSCRSAYPNLEQTLQHAAAVLDQQPLVIEGRFRSVAYSQRLDGSMLMAVLRMALYESELIPQIPRALVAAGQGRADEVWHKAIAIQAILPRKLLDVGAHYSFACRESVPFSDLQRLQGLDTRMGWLRHAATDLAEFGGCRIWNVPAAPAFEHERVHSDIPALLLAGEYDPATPPSNAESVARGLRLSHVVVFPGLGHWVTANTVSDCPRRIALAFLENPARAPDRGCITEIRTRWAVK